MTHNRAMLLVLVLGVVWSVAVQPVDARHRQGTGSRPGLGVTGVGVSAVFVPAPGVATPTTLTKSVTTPMVTGNPGATAHHTTTPMVTGNPGAASSTVTTESVTAPPGVATSAVGVSGLPHGYYTSIPSNAVQVMHKGEMVYSASGVYWRPEYYMGSLVYVVVK